MPHQITLRGSPVDILDGTPSINPPAYFEGEDIYEDDNTRDPATQKIFSAVENDSGHVILRQPTRRILTRGLQIPSRTGCPSTGFTLPKILRQAGISKQEWKAFTHEVKHPANLRISQWMAALGRGFLIGLVPPFGPLIACIIWEKASRQLELENIIVAGRSGALAVCAARWNEKVFQFKGLLVRIDVPGQHNDMKWMDLSSSSLYQYQQSTGSFSSAPGTVRPSALDTRRAKKELRYQMKEGNARLKAACKARIVVVPVENVYPIA